MSAGMNVAVWPLRRLGIVMEPDLGNRLVAHLAAALSLDRRAPAMMALAAGSE